MPTTTTDPAPLPPPLPTEQATVLGAIHAMLARMETTQDIDYEIDVAVADIKRIVAAEPEHRLAQQVVDRLALHHLRTNGCTTGGADDAACLYELYEILGVQIGDADEDDALPRVERGQCDHCGHNDWTVHPNDQLRCYECGQSVHEPGVTAWAAARAGLVMDDTCDDCGRLCPGDCT